jgi:hypothetical protein
MKYNITSQSTYLVGQLFGRETAEEMREFLHAVASENKTFQRSHILLDVRASRPLFHIERLELFDCIKQLCIGPSCKIALLGDSRDLCISHEYLALRALQEGLNVRSFRDWVEAFDWLNKQHWQQERREPRERRGESHERRGRNRRARVVDQPPAS